VDEGEIEATISDSHIALLNRRHYPGAVIKGAVNDRQLLGWAVNPKARRLLESINIFFRTIKANGKYSEIYDKYYGDVEDFDYVDLSVFHRRVKSRLSRYSPFIKAAANKHGFDWRLIVAQIYQESHLNPWAKSRAGARGLMQLLPNTARSLGVKDIYNPVENINAGVQHLKNLYEYFSTAEEEDRLLISLAAYNVGQGHIRDARNLAIQMSLDPDQWSSLAKTLPLLRHQKYYENSEFGYCRGTEPITYIEQIMAYYDILKRQGIEYGTAQAGS
jgi:membrane-bound lytic murein transglycosylase F